MTLEFIQVGAENSERRDKVNTNSNGLRDAVFFFFILSVKCFFFFIRRSMNLTFVIDCHNSIGSQFSGDQFHLRHVADWTLKFFPAQTMIR